MRRSSVSHLFDQCHDFLTCFHTVEDGYVARIENFHHHLQNEDACSPGTEEQRGRVVAKESRFIEFVHPCNGKKHCVHRILVSDSMLISGTAPNDRHYVRSILKHSCALHKRECRGPRDMVLRFESRGQISPQSSWLVEHASTAQRGGGEAVDSRAQVASSETWAHHFPDRSRESPQEAICLLHTGGKESSGGCCREPLRRSVCHGRTKRVTGTMRAGYRKSSKSGSEGGVSLCQRVCRRVILCTLWQDERPTVHVL